ncbi:MAG TPA: NifB/NifX family molybdenum-iron cluster-binding protein [Desulfatiglandales bacterium]|nr:NifB/NifX family molybdenum-iron cluster-binding protein [Desulfatiglandales bacterium]
MKRIAVACEDNQGLGGQISQHFGRCPYYLILDLEGDEIIKADSIANPYYNDHTPGMVPKFISEQGANVMIAGGIGPRAIDLFAGMGIEVVSGMTGNAGDIVQAYLKGEISGVEACQQDHPEGHSRC